MGLVMADKKREYETKIEREMRQVASALTRNQSTTTAEGVRQYRRIERQASRMVKDNHVISEWQRLRQKLVDFLNKDF